VIGVLSANEAVVAWLCGEHDAENAVGVEVADYDVRVIIDVKVGAYATTCGGVRELGIDADPRSLSIGDGLRDNGVTLGADESARYRLHRGADTEARARGGPGGRCARTAGEQNTYRRADNSTPPHMGVSERVMYTIKHT
jgi:hypothetical protein